MTTNRGDMPAMPQSIAQSQDGGIHLSSEYGYEGMTIREQFAMATPDTIPDWFKAKFRSEYKEFESPLTEVEVTHYIAYREYDYAYPHFDEGAKVAAKLDAASTQYEAELNEALYFAWRAYYADALLTELEHTK